MERQIGQVTHYYNRIGVAVLNLDKGLKMGDAIRVRGRHTDFTQTVESMEIEHQKVELDRSRGRHCVSGEGRIKHRSQHRRGAYRQSGNGRSPCRACRANQRDR